MLSSWKWMDGKMLTGCWSDVDRTVVVESGQFIWSRRSRLVATGRWVKSDRTLSARVRSTPVRFQRRRILIERVWLVLTGCWSGSGYWPDVEQRSDRTLGSSIRSTSVRVQRAVFMTGHVRSVLTGCWTESGHNLTARWRGELIGASGHLDRSVRSPRSGT